MKTKQQLSLSTQSNLRLPILILVFFLLKSIPALSQCTINGSTCAEAIPISFPFSGNMNTDINGAGVIIGCNGQGFLHNSTWYSIKPTSDFVFIEVTGFNCTFMGGNEGYQIGLFPDCDPNSIPVGSVQCDCAASGQPVTIGGQVTPNETYYILVDGCSGSACDLEMVLLTGTTVLDTLSEFGIPETPKVLPAGPTCLGAQLNFSVPPFAAADSYSWSIPSDASIISQNCNSINVIWGGTSGDVSVTVTNNTTGETNQSLPLFVTVEPIEQSIEGSYCGSSSNGFLFVGDGQIYNEGIHDLVLPGINCDTFTTLTVTNSQPILTITGSNQTCEDEGIATVEVTGGIAPYTYFWNNPSASTTPTIENLLSGTYSVTVTDLEGCSAEGTVFILSLIHI